MDSLLWKVLVVLLHVTGLNCKPECTVHPNSEMDGWFSSPDYPEAYPTEFSCEYILPADIDHASAVIIFKRFELEASSNCAADYLSINNVSYCGKQLENDQLMVNLPAVLKFHSNKNITGRGFIAEYFNKKKSLCSITQSNRTFGQFFSPGYPSVYPNNFLCNYYLMESKNYDEVQITFDDFILEYSFYCHFDSLRIGKDIYCGNELRGKTITRRLPVVLTFSSDSEHHFRGFNAKYQYIDKVCQLHPESDTQGHIYSPGFPGKYRNDFNCKFTFPKTTYNRLTIKFDTFRLEDSVGCKYDKLIVGNTSFCGKQLEGHTITLAVPFDMTFITDDKNSGEGFKASYRFGKDCELDFETDKTGLLVTPGYPNVYPKNYNCTFDFPVKDSYTHVEVQFNTFDLASDCLEVKGVQKCKTSLAGTTVFMPLPAALKFVTGSGTPHKGFNANFTYLNECVFHETSQTSGYFTSPQYPKNYRNNFKCVYNIPQQHTYQKIQIQFMDFHLEGSSLDALQINNVKYSGHDLTNRKVIVKLPLNLKFYSDSSGTYKGFNATYTYLHDWELQPSSDTSGIFKSPRYPENYPVNTNYTLKIPTKDFYSHVLMTFVNFNLEFKDNCQKGDYLLINGTKYCGDQLHNTKHYFKVPVSLRFHSDAKLTFEGFEASYQYVEVCQVKPTNNTSGYLFTLGYPHYYPSNTYCQFKFPKLTKCRIYFSNMDISKNDAVYLTAADGQISKYIGDRLKSYYFDYVPGKKIELRTGDKNGVHRGFVAYYTIKSP